MPNAPDDNLVVIYYRHHSVANTLVRLTRLHLFFISGFAGALYELRGNSKGDRKTNQ